MPSIILTNQKTSKNKDVNIGVTSDIKTSECFTFFMDEYMALVRSGEAAEQYISEPAPHSAVFAEINGEIVGVIAYKINADLNSAWITIASVHAAHRGNGIYSLMYDTVEKHLVSARITMVSTMFKPSNTAMLAAAENAGFETKLLKVSKKIQ